jgi:hypothetical protein
MARETRRKTLVVVEFHQQRENGMADIAELEQRVSAVEADAKRGAKGLRNDVHGLRDDVLGLQDDIQGLKRDAQEVKRDGKQNNILLNAVNGRADEIHARVVANELTTKQGFVEVNGRLDRMETEIGAVKADVAALRCDLPTMIAETMREVLKESRGRA